MCRSCSDGGRRCPGSEASKEQGRAAANRYYQRAKARRKIAELADAGIPALGDDDMPTTFHQHAPDQPVVVDDSRTLTNPDRAIPDKPSGALWSSPGRIDADGNTKTAWTDWAAQEDYGKGGQLAEISARPGAVIVTIDSPSDAEALMGKYGTQDVDGKRSFDWVAMREDGIDGVHVSDAVARGQAYVGRGDGTAVSNLHGWSAGSVAWLSSDRLEVGESRAPGTYTYAEGEDDDPSTYRSVEPEEGEGRYDEPPRPDTESAWERVPNRFKQDREAPPAVHPETDGDDDVAPYEYGRGQQGVKVPEPINLLDLGNTLLAGASPRRKKAGRGRR